MYAPDAPCYASAHTRINLFFKQRQLPPVNFYEKSTLLYETTSVLQSNIEILAISNVRKQSDKAAVKLIIKLLPHISHRQWLIT